MDKVKSFLDDFSTEAGNMENQATVTDKNYDVEEVVEKMLARRDRRIPGSVYKPHNEQVILIQSVALG